MRVIKGLSKKLIYLILITPLLYFPGLLAYAEVGSKVGFFSLIISILFCLFTYLILFKKEKIKVGIVTLIVGMYTIILAISTIFAFNFNDSFWGGEKGMNGFFLYFCLFLFFLIVSSLLKKEEEWEKLIMFSVGAASFVSLVAFFQHFNLLTIPMEGSLIGNSSFLGTYLLFNFFFAVYLFSKRKDPLYLALAFFMTLPLYWFSSRAALGAILIGVIIIGMLWIVFRAKKEKIRKIGKIFLTGSVVVAVFICFLIFHPVNNGIFNGHVGNVEDGLRTSFYNASDGLRYIFWEQSTEGFKENPFFGWGLNNFQHIFLKEFNPEVLVREASTGIISVGDPHNVIYEKLSSVGIIGLLAHLILIFGTLSLLWVSYKKGRVNFYAPLVFTPMITAYFLQQMTVYDTYNNLILFFLFLGFVNFYSFNREVDFKIISKNWKLIIMIVVAIISGFILYTGFYKNIRANYFLAWAIAERDPEVKIALSEEAIRLSTIDRKNTRIFLADNTRRYLYEEIITKEARQYYISFYIKELEKEDSGDWRVLIKKAHYYFLDDNYEKAREVVKEAQEASPRNPKNLWLLAEINVAEGDFEEAKSIISEFIAMEPRIEYSYSFSIFLAKVMQDEGFEESIKTMKIKQKK
ncbi:MAG: hypothetical protein U9P61_01560 [Patescibacteria group bacterium]|nr:hypothetical protein [Patescibacteria group bacterium]